MLIEGRMGILFALMSRKSIKTFNENIVQIFLVLSLSLICSFSLSLYNNSILSKPSPLHYGNRTERGTALYVRRKVI